MARILARPLSEFLGQQVIIENVGGAGGMTGAARVAKAARLPVRSRWHRRNAVTDFIPVVLIAELPNVLVVRKEFPASNLPEFMAYVPPHGTPAPIVRKLHDATVAARNIPSVQKRLNEFGTTLVPSQQRSQEYLRKFVDGEIEKWASVIKAAGVTID